MYEWTFNDIEGYVVSLDIKIDFSDRDAGESHQSLETIKWSIKKTRELVPEHTRSILNDNHATFTHFCTVTKFNYNYTNTKISQF